jgi:hypothetical protein
MSARQAGGAGSVHTNINGHHVDRVIVHAREQRMALSSSSIVIHKGGVEFRSSAPFSSWTEMTVSIQSSLDGSRIHCNGVVISCTGNRHTGYHVSMVFTGLSRQAQARMASWSSPK